jgi:hypothetical protein
MYIYLYRFYDPLSERWLNRDPIEELGGMNLFAFVDNCPVNYGDPFGLDPGQTFPTKEDAAKDACNYVYPKTQKDGVEYGGWITQTPDKKFTYNLIRGTRDSTRMGPMPDNAAAMYHSHAKGPQKESFSGAAGGVIGFLTRGTGDVRNSDLTGVSSYLVTPSGTIKRYDPDPNMNGKGPISTIGSVFE